MACNKVKDGFICSNDIVKHNGFLIEFPPIGCPAMLDPDTHAVIEYEATTDEFWAAVEDYQLISKNK